MSNYYAQLIQKSAPSQRNLLRTTLLFCSFTHINSTHAEEIPTLSNNDNIVVKGISPILQQTTNTTSLFQNSLGFSTYNTGGTSSLPVLNGMADDRVATFIDGMRLGAECPNHMNPALSQIDPDAVSHNTAIAGITPVSLGGDSIAGTLSVERKSPQFAENHDFLITGHTREDWRSNGGGSGASGSITIANNVFSLRYSASYSHASDYTTGGQGGHVPSTSYLTYNHTVTGGMRHNNHLLTITIGQQDTPYEGFPNQYMDETNNRSLFINSKYHGTFSWGEITFQGFWQRVNHAMNMLSDKGGHSTTRGMPMNTNGRTAGYTLSTTIPIMHKHHLKIGSAFEHNGLNDWWPPIANSMMMGPNTYHNLNNAHRDHLGHFIQWNTSWNPYFSTEIGVRHDLIMMNTGPVAPYNTYGMMNMSSVMAAQSFNSQHRGHTDNNIDITTLATWTPTHFINIEGGYAQKTRSPNLYERYSWGMSPMSSRMVGWFGDGNGYVGTPTLKPEIAHTTSMTLHLHDALQQSWDVTIQPFYTYTHNYINVLPLKPLSRGLSLLQFENHNAQTYGLNTSTRLTLWNTPSWGQGSLTSTLNWVRGQDLTMHSGLYQQMPLNALITLHEQYGSWHGHLEATLVKAKHTVDWLRNEARTPGYALLGIGGGYHWRMLHLEINLENLLNQRYSLPLGGRAVATTGTPPAPVLAMGRSLNLTLQENF